MRRGQREKIGQERAVEKRAEQKRAEERGQKRGGGSDDVAEAKGTWRIFVPRDPICKYSHEGQILGSTWARNQVPGFRVIWQNCNRADLEVYANHQFNHKLRNELTCH